MAETGVRTGQHRGLIDVAVRRRTPRDQAHRHGRVRAQKGVLATLGIALYCARTAVAVNYHVTGDGPRHRRLGGTEQQPVLNQGLRSNGYKRKRYRMKKRDGWLRAHDHLIGGPDRLVLTRWSCASSSVSNVYSGVTCYAAFARGILSLLLGSVTLVTLPLSNGSTCSIIFLVLTL